MKTPIIDLHCDMTYYFVENKAANAMNVDDIGCAIPHLQKGNVVAQVMAFFTPSKPIEHGVAMQQAKIFNSFLKDYPNQFNRGPIDPKKGTTILAAIENASGFCHEDEKLDDGLRELDKIIELTGGIFYIGFMHWGDSRFGGAAGSKTGLKNDGKVLLDYINNKNIAVDLSHAGDALAYDIFNYTDSKNLNIPILASHSNHRILKNHDRNLTDELSRELIKRGGLIGLNFMSPYIGDDDKPDTIYDHIEHSLKLGAEEAIAIGADFFFDDERQEQIYYPKFNSASCYPILLDEIEKRFSKTIVEKIAYKNAQRFIQKQIKL
ncbi:MAG: peptidase [Calditrichaeota bacterium]|nr:MAG: peptidase [Calditrichota bacterium]MBL1205116.1 peptidase [Calditrichota bacterium]NOG44946.1 peptidase [Calditrichota bacterium]